jgi:hypothetical protein
MDRELAKGLIFCALEKRITPRREAERADRRQGAYDEARELHDATSRRVKEFLTELAPRSAW